MNTLIKHPASSSTGTNHFLDAALAYAELGYAVFPCIPREKRPLITGGLLAATTKAAQIVKWWQEYPSANIGLCTKGLLVVDLDRPDNPWLQDEPDKFQELSVTACSQTPAGGKHFIFRQPEGMKLKNTTGKLARNVDTRADGGYILVAPSAVDGQFLKPQGSYQAGRSYAYQWLTPLDFTLSLLPTPPAWIITGLESRSGNGTRLDFADDGNAIPDGQRNSALTSLAGVMRDKGMGPDEIRAAISVTNSKRCKPPLPDSEIDTIVKSVSRYEPNQFSVAAVEGWGDRISEVAENALPRAGKFPEHLLKVPGVIGDLVEHNILTAPRSLPIVALAGAIGLVSVLTGRKIADESDMRTNLYLIAVAESGGGKDFPRTVNKKIFMQAGMENYCGAEAWASDSSIINTLHENPCTLYQTDEIGRVLQTMASASRNPQQFEIITVLMRLFTSANTFITGKSYADTKNNKIVTQPHCCIFGTTTPDQFYQGLTIDNLSDGFLGRTLVFHDDDGDPSLKDEIVRCAPPQSAVSAAMFWKEFLPNGTLSSKLPDPYIVPYTDDAKLELRKVEKLAQSRKNLGDQRLRSLWLRVSEKTRKLSLIWACSENYLDPIVTVEAVRWASEIAVHLTARMIEVAVDHISESVFDSIRLKVLRAIRDKAQGVSGVELCRATRGLTKKQRDDALEALKLAGDIMEISSETSGRPQRVFCVSSGIQPFG
jgi:hypothetical protein